MSQLSAATAPGCLGSGGAKIQGKTHPALRGELETSWAQPQESIRYRPAFLVYNTRPPKKQLLEIGVRLICKEYGKSSFGYSPGKTNSKTWLSSLAASQILTDFSFSLKKQGVHFRACCALGDAVTRASHKVLG